MHSFWKNFTFYCSDYYLFMMCKFDNFIKTLTVPLSTASVSCSVCGDSVSPCSWSLDCYRTVNLIWRRIITLISLLGSHLSYVRVSPVQVSVDVLLCAECRVCSPPPLQHWPIIWHSPFRPPWGGLRVIVVVYLAGKAPYLVKLKTQILAQHYRLAAKACNLSKTINTCLKSK